MSKFKKVKPWPVEWYHCYEGGKLLWSVPTSIGPFSPDHNHWAGWNLDCDDIKQVEIAAAAPVLYDAAKQVLKHWDDGDLAAAVRYLQEAVNLAEGCDGRPT